MKLKSMLVAVCAIMLIGATPVLSAKTLLKANALASYYGAPFHGKSTSSGELFDMYKLTAAHKTLPYGTMLEITNLENGNSVVVRVNDRGPHVDDREVDVSLGAAEKLGMITTGMARVSIYILDESEAGETAQLQEERSAPEPLVVFPVQSEPIYELSTAATQTFLPAQGALPAQPAESEPEPAPPARPPYPSARVSPAPEQPPQPLSDQAGAERASDPDSQLWRIQLGAFSREENAIRLVRELRAIGLEPAYERSGETVRVVLVAVRESEIESIKARLLDAGIYDYILHRER